MKQTRERDINEDTTFTEIGKELGGNYKTAINCNKKALEKALKYLEQNGFKKTDFFGED